MNSVTKKVLRGAAVLATVAMLLPQPQAFAQDGAEPNDVPRVYIPLVGGAAGPQQQDEGTVRTVPADENAAAVAYWTPSVRAEAEAAAAAEASAMAAEAPSPAAQAEIEAAGAGARPGSAAGTLPNPAALAEAQRDFADAWKEVEQVEEIEAAALAAPDDVNGTYSTYSSWPGNYYTTMWRYFPYQAVGKIYSTRPDGSRSVCTATVISSRSIIATGANCIYDTRINRFHRNVLFIPAERGGLAPYGSFSPINMTVPGSYAAAPSWGEAIRWDVGLIRLQPNAFGRPVTYYTGSLGRTWNTSYIRNVVEVGYSSHFSTSYTSVSTAETYAYRPNVFAFGSPFRGAGVGSPLIMGFAPHRLTGYVGGVHGGWLTTGSTGVGARFTTDNLVSLCNTLGGC